MTTNKYFEGKVKSSRKTGSGYSIGIETENAIKHFFSTDSIPLESYVEIWTYGTKYEKTSGFQIKIITYGSKADPIRSTCRLIR